MLERIILKGMTIILWNIRYPGVKEAKLRLLIEMYIDLPYQMMYNIFHLKKEYINGPNKFTPKLESSKG